MDLKHIESLAKDKELTNAWFCSYFQDILLEDYKDDYENEYNFNSLREWQELTDNEKIKLIELAKYYWCKAVENEDVNAICVCVMLNQNKLLKGTMDKWAFLRKLQMFW